MAWTRELLGPRLPARGSRALAVITASDFCRLETLRHVRGPEDARVRSASNRDVHPALSTVALLVAIMVLVGPQELEDQ